MPDDDGAIAESIGYTESARYAGTGPELTQEDIAELKAEGAKRMTDRDLRTKFYYLATPYMDADPFVRQRRFEQAKRAAEDAIRRGLVAWSPIASSHPMALNGIVPPQGWYQWDLNLLETIDPDRLVVAVVKIPGWDKSHGVQLEIQWAEHHGVQVEYWDWDPDRGIDRA